MGRAMLDLYGATGGRAWLTEAKNSGQFILEHFSDKQEPRLLHGGPAGERRAVALQADEREYRRRAILQRFVELFA